MSQVITYPTTDPQFNDTENITLQKILQVTASGGGGGGGGSGFNQIKTYVANPNTEGVVPENQSRGAVAYPTVANAGPMYNWNTATHIWE